MDPINFIDMISVLQVFLCFVLVLNHHFTLNVDLGPNILAWSEWEYFNNVGDRERLQKVFVPLVAYHRWMREQRTWLNGTYFTCGLGSGMDNQVSQSKQLVLELKIGLD